MQKNKYVCDGCEKEIGDNKHVSLNISSSYSANGIAMPPTKKEARWTVKEFSRRFIHFCSGKCAGVWFEKELSNK